MTRRIFRGLAGALLLAALTAGAASAGGWATITADPGSPQQPNAGEPFTFGFTVLQHGVTPAGWEQATFLAINASTGEQIEVKATPQGADGHFVATVTLPAAGYWTWQVTLRDLIVETTPQPMAVANADGTVPAMDTAAMTAALERMRSEVRTELQDQLFTETDALRSQINALQSRVTKLSTDRDTLTNRFEELQAGAGSTGVPLVGVIAISVLAGALSAFAITMLGRRGSGGPGITTPAAEDAAPVGVLTTR